MKKKPVKQVHGIRVGEITHKEPGNGLPKWVREAATERGYCDAEDPLSLFVNERDIKEAFSCAAQGNGAKCVMAQAGQRLGAESVYFYRSTAWVDFGGDFPILRFKTTKSIYNNIIDPFDRGDRDAVIAGIYPLTPPTGSHKLERRREYNKNRTGRSHNRRDGDEQRRPVAHTERVVMASRA